MCLLLFRKLVRRWIPLHRGCQFYRGYCLYSAQAGLQLPKAEGMPSSKGNRNSRLFAWMINWMRRVGIKLLGNTRYQAAGEHPQQARTLFARNWLFGFSIVTSTWSPKYRAHDQDACLPILRVEPQCCSIGNENILYGFIFTTVRMNNDLTTFIRVMQCEIACDAYIRVKIEFSSRVVVITRWLGRWDTKTCFASNMGIAKEMVQPSLLKIRITFLCVP